MTLIANRNFEPAKWDSYILGKQNHSTMALSSWLKTIDAVHPVKTILLTAEDESGMVRGGVAGYHLPARGRVLYSLPFGFVADNKDFAQQVGGFVREYCEEQGLVQTYISSGFADYQLRSARIQRLTVTLDINNDEEQIWSSMTGKARNKVRKAEKNGIELVTGHDHLKAFHKVYATRLLSKNVNVAPEKFFDTMGRQQADRLVLYAAKLNQKIVGGVVFQYADKTASYIYNACLPELINLGVNNLLMWEAIKDAAKRGCASVDFGESKEGSGVYDYKTKQLGGKPKEIYYHDIMRFSDQPATPLRSTTEERLLQGLNMLRLPLPRSIKRSLNARRIKFGKLL